MKTTNEVLATFNCPEKAVKHNGVWMWPEELSPPKLGEFYWNHLRKFIDTAECKFGNPSIIFRLIPLPPKPTPEHLAKIAPAGKVAALKDEPDCESVPFVNDDCRFICTHEDSRAALYHGLRWPVTLTDAPKDPVKRWVKCTRNGALRAIAAFEDEKCVSIDCNDGSVTKILSDTGYSLWSLDTLISESEYNLLKAEWTGKKVKAEPVAVKVEPWCNVPDYPGSSNQIQRAIEQLQRAVDELRAK